MVVTEALTALWNFITNIWVLLIIIIIIIFTRLPAGKSDRTSGPIRFLFVFFSDKIFISPDKTLHRSREMLE